MSARDLFPIATLPATDAGTPGGVARHLLGSIKDIEALVSGNQEEIDRISQRGWLSNLFSSTHKDLVAVSKGQNNINNLMLGLIQEVVGLNTMSYSFLVAVIAELEDRARNGWTDAEGKFQTLSATGQDFADKARHIFLAIAEGSQHTQQRIDDNTRGIAALSEAVTHQDQTLGELDDTTAAHSRELHALHEMVARLQADHNTTVQRLEVAQASQQRQDDALRMLARDHANETAALRSELAALHQALKGQSAALQRTRGWSLAAALALVAGFAAWVYQP